MVILKSEEVQKRSKQCPFCMYFYAQIDRCRGFRTGGMLAMFNGETNKPCQKYRTADFKGIVKHVNEDKKTVVFSLGALDPIFDGVPVFEVPSEDLR